MRKLTVLSLILLLLFVGGCSSSSKTEENKGANAPATQKEPDSPGVTDTSVKIGAWLPTAGAAAINGLPQKLGLDAYYKLINDKGGVNGRKIEMVVEDTERDPQKTVAGAHKLIERDQVFALISPFGNAQTAATFQYVLDEAKVPLLNAYGGQTKWYDPPKPYLYGAMVVYEDQAKTVGRWMAKEGAKNILVVHDDPAAYQNVAKAYEPGAKSADPNVKVSLLSVKLGTQDYVPVALQVIAAKPDAIGFVGPPDELASLAKELARQNKKIPLYTYAPLVSNDMIKLGGPAVEGLRAVSWTVPPDGDSPALKEYQEAIKAISPDAKPDYQSLFTYAEAKIFVEALSRVQGPLTRDNFIKALETVNNFETGILPPVTYTATKHLGISGLQRVQVENGKWKTVGDFVDPNAQW